MAKNQLSRLRLLRGDIGTDSGTLHAQLNLDESVAYIDRVFDDYREQSGLARFYGRVAEIGPGDNCGVALRFLDDGCEQVDLADRFFSLRDESSHAKIYRSLIARSDRLNALFGTSAKESDFRNVTRYYGDSAAAEKFFLRHTGYDFIVSRAVLEHVQDPVLALRRMMTALNPGGMMLHVVDLRDHGMFSRDGYPPLKFLEIPQPIYREMTCASGHPNRVPLSAYRNTFPASGYEVDIKVTYLVGQGRLDKPTRYPEIPAPMWEAALSVVRAGRWKFANRFREERDEDLAVSGFFLVAKKSKLPAATAG